MVVSNIKRWRWSASIFGILAVSSAAFAIEPLKIDAEGRTTPISVEEELGYFLGKKPVINLRQIERMGNYQGGEILHDAWSDTYWPDIQGGIAAPYADGDAIGSFILFGNFRMPDNKAKFFNTHALLWNNPRLLTEDQIEKMSPAEKYDLLVGDYNFTLSKTVWDKIEINHFNSAKTTKNGQFIYDKDGEYVLEPKKTPRTPYWYGICNGWAAASLALDRPQHPFTLTNAFGQRIKFWPSDVQALASHLWARSPINNALDGPGSDAKPVIRHSGYRCRERTTSRDFFTGRPKNEACNDVNPAIWHLAMINRIGMERMGFIADTNIEDGVWNHPITGYSFSYVNMNDGSKGNLENSKLPSKEYSNFQKYRSRKATHIVGVEMYVNFLSNNDAARRESYGKDDDKRGWETYYYFLELDPNDNVVGGEWIVNRPSAALPGDSGMNMGNNSTQTNHPDFIWSPLPGWKALAIGDRLLGVDYGTWNGNGAVPEGIRTGALKSSPKSQPLAEVVDLLIKHSRK